MIDFSSIKKCLFIGDTHQKITGIRRAANFCEKNSVDCIIQVGDFGFNDNTLPYIRNKNIPLFFIDGNHEYFDFLGKYKKDVNEIYHNIYYLKRGSFITFGKSNMLFCGGACSIDKHHRVLGESYFKEEDITDDDVDACLKHHDERVDVFVCHECPTFLNVVSNVIAECQLNRDKLEYIWNTMRPSLTISGHYHQFHSKTYRGFPFYVLDRCDFPKGQSFNNALLYDCVKKKDIDVLAI